VHAHSRSPAAEEGKPPVNNKLAAAQMKPSTVNQPETISAGHLEAVRQILNEVEPDLSHHIKTIVQQGPLQEPSKRGQSTFVNYPFTIRVGDANAILSALEEAEETHGPDQKFCGFSIRALIMIWQGLLVRLA
jgi:hypothetical protein